VAGCKQLAVVVNREIVNEEPYWYRLRGDQINAATRESLDVEKFDAWPDLAAYSIRAGLIFTYLGLVNAETARVVALNMVTPLAKGSLVKTLLSAMTVPLAASLM
jgi:hypothetical protein